MNSKFLSLPLRELNSYVKNLEDENEKLRNDLSTIYKFNFVLENIKLAFNKGYSAMKCIDRNKSCSCQEHMNGYLRRILQEVDIELSVWMNQYDGLVNTSNNKYHQVTHDDSSRESIDGPTSENSISKLQGQLQLNIK